MVGIITFHRAINYGALLQAYALHKVLNDLGVENCIVDYRCQHIEKEYHLLTDYKYCKSIKSKIVRTLNLPTIIAKRRKFHKFIDSYIKLNSKKALNREDLLENWRCTGCDIIITGSDQVWHNGVTNFDKTYFLDFLSKPEQKKSYAASFGFNEIPAEYLPEYKNLLSGFSHISVREKAGAEIIKKLFDKDVPVVLDPTLLISKDQWKKLASGNVKITNYILVFCIVATDSILSFAEDLKNRTGCSIVIVNDKTTTSLNAIRGLGIGPLDFLDLFIHATYIVTNSYHGTAFSINLNKNLFVELQSYANNTNTRIQQLLDLFGLNQRVINKNSNAINLDPIQYKNVNDILQKERQYSLSYLEEMTITANITNKVVELKV